MVNLNPVRGGCGLLLATVAVTMPAVVNAEQLPGFDCVITPSQVVELGSPVPGQLQDVRVDRSDRVEAGQVVATLDSRLERANLEIARFRAETDTELRLRQAALVIDLRSEQRLTSLAATNVASQQDRDRAKREAVLSEWRTRQAKEDLRLQELEYARARAVLDRRTIHSPIDGVVAARLRNAGEYVEDQPLLRLVKLDPLHVEAILPMQLFGQVHAGMDAEVVPEFNEAAAYRVKVDLVDPMGDAGSGTFGVRLSLPNPEQRIPAGVKCRVRLALSGVETQADAAAAEQRPDFAMVPADSPGPLRSQP